MADDFVKPRVFAEISPGVPDGFRCDIDGNVWTSARNGVHCYAPDGTLLGHIRIPTIVANLTFGGPRRNRLFITASNALYSVFVATSGAQTPLNSRTRAHGELIGLPARRHQHGCQA